jgi:hypothetical protein
MNLNTALSITYDQLNAVAQSPDYWTILNTVFGTNYNSTLATTLQQQWQAGDFSALPTIEILSSEVLGNASGAYATSNNTIYLADTFVATATPEALNAVILEEIGHFVDAKINNSDTPGDEGELFSDLLRGIIPSAAELSRIKAENDHAVIVVNGQTIAVEQSLTQVGEWDPFSYAYAVTVVGNYAYAVGDRLAIIDISNPSNPIFKGSCDIDSGSGIQILGDYAYVADDVSGLQIINISNPAAPTLVGNYTANGLEVNFFEKNTRALREALRVLFKSAIKIR